MHQYHGKNIREKGGGGRMLGGSRMNEKQNTVACEAGNNNILLLRSHSVLRTLKSLAITKLEPRG